MEDRLLTTRAVVVGRHINGITINPLEYLLTADGEEMVFVSKDEAQEYLEAHGCTDEDIYWLVFEEVAGWPRKSRRF